MATAPSASDLSSKAGGLKKVEVKTSSGPSDAELTPVAKIYDDNKGDLAKIAAHFKCTFKDKASFKDGKDFAKQFLLGTCLKD